MPIDCSRPSCSNAGPVVAFVGDIDCAFPMRSDTSDTSSAAQRIRIEDSMLAVETPGSDSDGSRATIVSATVATSIEGQYHHGECSRYRVHCLIPRLCEPRDDHETCTESRKTKDASQPWDSRGTRSLLLRTTSQEMRSSDEQRWRCLCCTVPSFLPAVSREIRRSRGNMTCRGTRQLPSVVSWGQDPLRLPHGWGEIRWTGQAFCLYCVMTLIPSLHSLFVCTLTQPSHREALNREHLRCNAVWLMIVLHSRHARKAADAGQHERVETV